MDYPSFNIGIEEEYQFIEPQSRELLGYATLSMAREMSAGRGTLVLRLYGFIARSIGWQRTVRWSERVRSIIRFGTAARV